MYIANCLILKNIWKGYLKMNEDDEIRNMLILYIAIILFLMFLIAFGIYVFIWFLNMQVGG